MYSSHYRLIAAKLEQDNGESWLPLWMHLRDTAGVMERLVREWLPDSIIKSSGLEYETFRKFAVYLAACHDIGKATSYFQSIIGLKCDEIFYRLNDSGLLVDHDYRGKTPHAYAGQCILQSGMAGVKIDESIACIVGAHHGKPVDDINLKCSKLIETYPKNFYGRQGDEQQKVFWSNVWKEIEYEAEMASGLTSVDRFFKIDIGTQVLLSGLLIVADWLASNTDFFPLISLEDNFDEGVYPARIDAGWKKCNFPEGWLPEISVMDRQLFGERFGFMPNEVQISMLDIVNHCSEPGIFIIEAQMGCGKTEAALGAVEVLANKANCGGAFFALPTQATSNGMYHRMFDWAERVSEETKNAITLAHSGAQYNEEYQAQRVEGKVLVDDIDCPDNDLTVHPWFQGNKKALLADFVIGTVDQFLIGALKKKHFMLRHLGLVGKVIVIDECHAYDSYMNTYLDRMLEWMASYKIPVILLSATLPAKRRRELISAYAKVKDKAGSQCKMGYPLITWTDGREVHSKTTSQKVRNKQIGLRMIDGLKDLVTILDEKLSDGGCACVIANTVKRAQEYYDLVVNEMDNVEVILYHAQFLMPDRAEKEQELLKRLGKESYDKDRNRLILIGTQVLEQSLDYDADIMFSELCPIDLLLQRIGRLHRHNRNNMRRGFSRPQKLISPECYIMMDREVNEKYEYDAGSQQIYGDYLLVRTRKVLSNVLNIPEDIPKLVQAVYNEDDDLGLRKNPGYTKMEHAYSVMVGKKKSRAKTYLIKKPKGGLTGMLVNDDKSPENNGEKRVRDSGIAIEVILMRQMAGDSVGFMDEEKYGDVRVQKNSIPDDETARKILRQRIRLPQIFSVDKMIDASIEELEKRQREIAQWQKSPWLAGELVILFDKNDETSLNGYVLSYDYSKGLVYRKQEGRNG